MKQRITVEQLNELTPEQKQKLREWWTPEVGEIIYEDLHKNLTRIRSITCRGTLFNLESNNECYKPSCLPLLSIGQMIEFIGDNINDYGMQYYDTGCDWGVWFGYGPDIGIDKNYFWRQDELCDALWQAIKSIL